MSLVERLSLAGAVSQVFRLPGAPLPKPIQAKIEAPSKFVHEYERGVEVICERWMREPGSHHGGVGMIAGIASTPTIDAQRDSLSSAGCHFRLPVPLLYSHAKNRENKTVGQSVQEQSIGRVVWVEKHAGHIQILAVVDATRAGRAAWKHIVAGRVPSLSVGLGSRRKIRGVVDGVQYWDEWEMVEVSVCPLGANPDCKNWVY